MKLTNTSNMKATKSGMTLLELTVVILVLLSLISILFIGARAWKRGSDRAASILIIRNVQQAVRSFSNMNGYNPGQTVAAVAANETTGTAATPGLEEEVFGKGKFIEKTPIGAGKHPAGNGYLFAYVGSADKIPDVGTLYLHTTGGPSTGAEPTYFNPTNIGDW